MVTKPRNRILIFRLTQDEYQTLQNASCERGARSLSEFARNQLMNSIEASPIGDQISELRSTISRIAEMIEGTIVPERT